MEEDMDDFGDIYADVEGYVNAGVSMISSIRQLYLEDRAKAELRPGDAGDSEDEERLLYDRIGRDGRSDGGPASAAVAASHGSDGKPTPEGVGGGGDDEVREDSNDSDSDDDLRIVLNEEDCKRFVPPQRVGLGNGGLLAGAATNEDAEDESIIGAGVDHTSKERKWADLSQVPVEGLEQSSLERGGSLKSGFVMRHSQFKYVRSPSAGYPSNTKSTGQGYVVPFTSPMTLMGDWDMSGLLAAASCHIGFPVPRNRTIFDISIESFDQKPWRNKGIDITDFFNFGLNEESWKHYCDDMVHFRKQATRMARNTIYGSIRPKQPKGKAIQVEGGSGERLPSIDIRRPRYQDSDVVIQIPVKCSDKDAKMSTLSHDGRRNEEVVDSDKKEHPESRSIIPSESEEKLQSLPDSKGIDNEKPRKNYVQVLGITLASTDEVLHSSCPSSPQSISEPSKSDFSADKLQSPAKKSSFDSVAASDVSIGSSCDTSHADKVNDGADLQDPSLYLEEQRSPSEAELCDVVEDDNESSDLDKKGQNNFDSLRRYRGKLGKRSSCKHRGEVPSSLEQTKLSKNSESWRVAEKQVSKSPHTEHSHRNELDPSSRGNCHRRHHPCERRDCRCNDAKQTEHRIPKEDEHDWRMEFVIHKERNTRSISDHMPFGTENGVSVLHRPKTVDDHRWCVKPDGISEDRYMKHYIEGNDPRRFPYVDRNEAFQDDFDRNAPYRAWDKRSSHRRWERYDRNLCIEMDDSQEYVEDVEFWRYSNHGSLGDQTFTVSPRIDGRVLHESSHPIIYEHDSWRSSEMYDGHCEISGAREARFDKQREWDLLDPCTVDNFSPHGDHHEIGSHHPIITERGVHDQNTLSSRGRKSSRICQRRHMTEDKVSLRRQILGDLHFPQAYFSCESVYRHENSGDNPSLKFLHSHCLVNENRTRVPRKKGSIAKEQNYVWHREAVDGRLNGYEGKPHEKSGDVPYKKKKIRYDKTEGFNHADEVSQRKGNPGSRQKMEDLNTQVIHSTVGKVKKCDSGYHGTHCDKEPDDPAVMHDQDDSGLEEGQLVESEDDDAGTEAKKRGAEEIVPISSTEVRHAYNEKQKQVKDTSCNKKPIEYDSSHILETLAKMEKRRERFKEPIAPQKEHDNAQNTHSQVKVVNEEVKLERPTRKRRWGSVKNSAP